ncbi:MAG TPA: universal stress protein [Candidatus Binatia bacterium]|nr:universal stress protein [Candidatus Binatia bacterium]
MPVKRILWASDGSKESDNALRWAKMFATRFDAKVTALNVLETLNLDTLEVADDLKREISRIDSAIKKKETKRLTHVRTVLEKLGIKAEMRIARGVPHQEIIKAVQSRAIDLIAMGKRGLNLWGRMLLGSTTSRVLREAHVPVLTVRQAARKLTVKKILVPASFSPGDSASLEWALELARKFGAALFLLHVIEVHKSYNGVTGGFMGRLRDSATKQLQGMLDAIPSRKLKGVTLTAKVKAFPRAWSGIVDFVRQEGIDIIVMSTHARKGAPRLFLGSVAESVTKEAPCPVITVTPQAVTT